MEQPVHDEEKGLSPSQWKGYPAHRVERDANSQSLRMWLREPEDTELHLRIPASCIEAEPCVEVKGTIQVSKLKNARLHVQSGLFTGFPGSKPNVETLFGGSCPTRADGYPVAGDTGCCYTPESVGNCTSSPYNKECESFIAGSLVLGGEKAGWGFEQRQAGHPDDFDKTTIPHQFDNAAFQSGGTAHNFSMEVDFGSELYKLARFGENTWSMNETLMKFSRDRNCNHIHDWPGASFEFSLRLEPVAGSKVSPDAEVRLTHLEVNRKRNCGATKT